MVSGPTRLTVYGRTRLVKQPADVTGLEGGEAVLSCEAEVDRRLEESGLSWRWSKDGQLLTETDSTVVMRSLDKEQHAGRYRCTAYTR